MAVDRDSLLLSLQSLLAQRFGLMLAVAAGVALAAGAWMWGQTPDYRVLYTNLSDRDGGAIIASLQQMNVPYKFSDAGGALLVPAGQVHEMRLRLASQGLPKGGLPGFELMESQKIGTSQFLEQVNYQRALEGELARSIQALSAVQSARVHLAISRPSVFMREQQKPSASVILNIYAGRTLDPQQISAIVHLVSTSVPDLPVKNVTVVDQSGNLLSAVGQATPNIGLEPAQIKYVQELEAAYIKRIEAILTPITGPGNVRAQVTAEVDFTQTEQAAEIYKPNQTQAEAAIRSQQISEAATSGSGPGGVPGALSNQPPVPATAPATAPANAAAAAVNAVANAVNNTRKESTVNYEVDKTIRHTRTQSGSVKRLSVAVVVNHRKQVVKGKTSYTPLETAELTQIQDLIKEAMGYSKERGDSLNVANTPFANVEPEKAPEMPFWKKPENIDMAKDIGKQLLIAGLVAFLFLSVLRPMFKSLATVNPPAQLMSPGAETGNAATATTAALPPPSGYETNLQQARQIAKSDPKVVANVVKNWVASNE